MVVVTRELAHHGILGQRWGIRRFQNKDGSLTDLGRKRLDKKALKRDGGEYQKQQTEFNKETVIAKGDYETALKHLEVFTEKELDTIIERQGKASKLRDFRVSELEKERKRVADERKEKFNQIERVTKAIGSISDATTKSVSLWNNIAKVSNTFFDTNLPLIGDGNKKNDNDSGSDDSSDNKNKSDSKSNKNKGDSSNNQKNNSSNNSSNNNSSSNQNSDNSSKGNSSESSKKSDNPSNAKAVQAIQWTKVTEDQGKAAVRSVSLQPVSRATREADVKNGEDYVRFNSVAKASLFGFNKTDWKKESV